MLKDITALSDRIDYLIPKVNCSGCEHRLGRKCKYYGAYLQGNIHKPTDCLYHKEKKADGNKLVQG